MNVSIIILAAGQGRRMYSDLPKVLHPLAGRPLLEHVHAAASELAPQSIYVVHGYKGEQVQAALSHLDVHWVEQAEQLGTGHAVKQVMPAIDAQDQVLILYGDVPLLTAQTLQALVEAAAENGIALLTCRVDEPDGYGRVVRDARGNITHIAEDQDATEEERAIDEINTGVMALKAKWLKQWLEKLETDNAQGEYYLTDVIGMAAAEKLLIHSLQPESEMEIMGVNDRLQLARLERYYQIGQAQHLMQQGLTLLDPARFDLRGALRIGRDVVIDVNVIIEGRVSIADGVSIGPNCVIKDAEIGQRSRILANSVIERAVIGKSCSIGPFARLRPDTQLADEVNIGNFVELKKAQVAQGSKINHLSYMGDSQIGRASNIGAGTITCNYDGARKHKTVIGDEVFVGSNTQLVAPVKIGNGATIAAGTTVTKDVPEKSLAISRTEQRAIKNWKRPKKE